MLGKRLVSEAQPGPGPRTRWQLLSEVAAGFLFVVESRRKEKKSTELFKSRLE